MINRFALLGIAAPVIYVVSVILGGTMREDYSHLAHPVSELIAAGAPNKAVLDPLFFAYNLLVIAFGTTLLTRLRSHRHLPQPWAAVLGCSGLILVGALGLATLAFPQDPFGATITTTGTIHIVLAGLTSLATMVTMLFMGLWLKSVAPLRALGAYSFWSLAIVFVSGAGAAAAIAAESALGGLVVRITIGGFLQWLFVIALAISRSSFAGPALGSGCVSITRTYAGAVERRTRM